MVRAFGLFLLVGLAFAQGDKGAFAAYAIQVGAFPTAEEAEQVRSRVTATCSPVFVIDRTGVDQYPHKVCAGYFVTYAEAWATKERLSKDTFPDCFITSGTFSKSVAVASRLPVRRPFRFAADIASDPVTSRILEIGELESDPVQRSWEAELPVWQLGHDDLVTVSLTGDPKDKRTVESMERLLSERPFDPESNTVRIRLARQRAETKSYADAERLFNRVMPTGNSDERWSAKYHGAQVTRLQGYPGDAYLENLALANDPETPPGLRRMCMRRAAGCAHAAKNHADAWLAFSQIAETDSDPAAVAEARMQLAGISFELKRNGKGDWDETRALCVDLLQDVKTPRAPRATAAIMHLETWYFEQRFAQCLRESDDFLQKFADVKREAGLVRLWRGLSLLELRRVPEAKVALEGAALQSLAANELFADTDPRPTAALWLAFVAKAERRPEDFQRWAGFIRTNYSKSPDAASLELVAKLP